METQFSSDEINIAISSSIWEEQIHFIEKLEDCLMKTEGVLDEEDFRSAMKVLSKYLTNDNKNLVQRSLRIICALYINANGPIFQEEIPSILLNVFMCLNDQKTNIREQASRTISTLFAGHQLLPFLNLVGEKSKELNPNGKFEVLQIIKKNIDQIDESDWNIIVSFIVQVLDEKITNMSKIPEITRNDNFIQSLTQNKDKFTSSQKKIVDSILEKYGKHEDETKQDLKSIKEEEEEKKVVKKKIKNYIVNTSAFSRKIRQSEANSDDGLKLLLDISSYKSFIHKLSIDVRDVFDDEIADLMLSNQSVQRLSSISILRDIFENSNNNFINSIDIILRWSCLQFVGRHLKISQAVLLLLLDTFNQCKEDFSLTLKEIQITVPIVLWCIATQSDAYTKLLHEIKKFSSEEDYANVLLSSIELEHNAILSTIFDEMKEIENLEKLTPKLEELSKSDNLFVQHECKILLVKSKQNIQKLSNLSSIEVLQEEILRIKNNPNDADDNRNLFNFLYNEFKSFPTDSRYIRYLLYCTYTFLSEPILSATIGNNELISLLIILCEFFSKCSQEFTEALNSIGFLIVSKVTSLPMFESLVDYIENHLETENRRSFSFQMFLAGVSLIAVSQTPNDLSQLRIFAKSIIGQNSLKKDDIRTILCEALQSEISLLEKQKHIDIEQSRYQEELLSNLNIQQTNDMLDNTEIESNIEEDNFDDLLFILKEIGKQDTRAQGIRD